MATKKSSSKKTVAEQADLFSSVVDQIDITEVPDTPKSNTSNRSNGPKDPHDPNTMDLNEDNKDSLTLAVYAERAYLDYAISRSE